MPDQQPLLLEEEAAATAFHAAQVAAAFHRAQAQQQASTDRWTGAIHAVMFLAVVKQRLHGDNTAAQLAAAAFQLLLFLLPSCLSWLACDWYLTRRIAIIACCLAAGWVCLSISVPPSRHPLLNGERSWGAAAAAAASQGWPGWLRFLALARVLGLNLLAWTVPLPFQFWLPLHLLGVAESMRLAVTHLCLTPAFSGCQAHQRFAAASRVAGRLATLLSPLTPPRTLQPAPAAAPAAALQVPAAAEGTLGAVAIAAAGAISGGPCACMQWSLFLLASLGCGLPIACKYITEVAARRGFVSRYCRQPRCTACIAAKTADVPMLAASAALLFAGYCVACWQLADALVQGGFLPGCSAESSVTSSSACF